MVVCAKLKVADVVGVFALVQAQQRQKFVKALGGGVVRAGRDDRWYGPPFVVRVGGHGQHRVDRAGFQQALGQPGRDARPLRPRRWCRQASAQHAPVRAKKHFIGAPGVTRPAVNTRFLAGIVVFDELTRLAAALGVAGA